MLLFCVHLLVGLHAASRVEATAYEAARVVAGDSTTPVEVRRQHATARARQLLGRSGDAATFSWVESTADVVVLSVSVPSPRVLPFGEQLGLDRVERTVRIRVERVR
jgi:hypothetical protein